MERVAVLVELGGPMPSHFDERPTFFAGSADRLVVHVGEISDMLHPTYSKLTIDQTPDQIVDDERAEIPNVRRRIDGRAAIVEPEDAVRLGGFEFKDFSLERVEKT